MEKFAGLPHISETQPERLIKYRVSEDGFAAEVLLPGFAYTDFDTKIGGKLSLWTLAQIFQSFRWEAVRHGLNVRPMLEDRTYFVASQHYSLEENINDITFDKHCGLQKPWLGVVYLSHCGTSSISMTTDLYDSGKRIGRNVTNFVFIDTKLRRPAPLPKEYVDSTKNHLKSVVHYVVPKRDSPEIPDSSSEYTLNAVFSDSDNNNHITQTAYLKWCSDAASVGAQKGQFRQFNQPIGVYPVKTMECHHLGEMFVGDTAVVRVWEDSNENDHLHFAVLKGEEIVYVFDITFYPTRRKFSNL